MPIVDCKICHKDFYVKSNHQELGWGKYCSNKCRIQSQLNGQRKKCFTCNKDVYRSISRIKRSKSGKFFCGKSCQTNWRNKEYVGEKHPNWSNGVRSYRERLINHSDTPVCELCGFTDMRALTAHHIDHNRKNNELFNLAWLCLNCHHLVHNDNDLENDFLEKMKISRCL